MIRWMEYLELSETDHYILLYPTFAEMLRGIIIPLTQNKGHYYPLAKIDNKKKGSIWKVHHSNP